MDGAFAAGLAALLGVSLVKKRHFLAIVAAADTRLQNPDPARDFRRWYGYRWRVDGRLATVGGILIGASVMALVVGIPPFVVVTLGIRVVLVAIAVVTCRQFWRSGESIGSAEGFS
ncbi:hypothetical protein [Lacisediminihabitans sp.]|jgi:hypothetical protein|uniref:hypothetical protein n=1 Tax=Lacisediminihabitans sp. TaxID=2787631 RepID=UPI002F95974E